MEKRRRIEVARLLILVAGILARSFCTRSRWNEAVRSHCQEACVFARPYSLTLEGSGLARHRI
jgi:hypothetical protein